MFKERVLYVPNVGFPAMLLSNKVEMDVPDTRFRIVNPTDKAKATTSVTKDCFSFHSTLAFYNQTNKTFRALLKKALIEMA